MTAAEDRAALIIDPRREICLHGIGSPGYHAVIVVDRHGTEHLVLASMHRIGDETARVDTTCAAAPHEQTGPLPDRFRHRIATASGAHRCGRRTAAGESCRIPVSAPGRACHWHRKVYRL